MDRDFFGELTTCPLFNVHCNLYAPIVTFYFSLLIMSLKYPCLKIHEL